jgi:hypothetical protein
MPTDNEIDYRRFTRAELLDAKANIDAERYPQNYQSLIAEIAFRDSSGRPEVTPQKPERISRIITLRGDVTRSAGTMFLYGAQGAFYLCLPLIVIWGFNARVDGPKWAILAIVFAWFFAAMYLFGFCVTYRFESGIIRCLWFGRHTMWQERLDTLESVESNFIHGLPTVYFAWPDHRRRLWLRACDLDYVNLSKAQG